MEKAAVEDKASIQRELLEMEFAPALVKEALAVSANKQEALNYIVSVLEAEYTQQPAQPATTPNTSATPAVEVPPASQTAQTEPSLKGPKPAVVDADKKNAEQKGHESDFESVNDDFKMIFLVRNDLKMGIGKIAAQVGHASLKAFRQIEATVDVDPIKEHAFFEWMESGQRKIVLKVNSEEELMTLYERAKSAGINACFIKDAGRTQIAPGSVTVAAIGPAEASELDKISGHLKLL